MFRSQTLLQVLYFDCDVLKGAEKGKMPIFCSSQGNPRAHPIVALFNGVAFPGPINFKGSKQKE
jgi:hypothetical protein